MKEAEIKLEIFLKNKTTSCYLWGPKINEKFFVRGREERPSEREGGNVTMGAESEVIRSQAMNMGDISSFYRKLEEGLEDSSVDKVLAGYAWRPEFSLQKSHKNAVYEGVAQQ